MSLMKKFMDNTPSYLRKQLLTGAAVMGGLGFATQESAAQIKPSYYIGFDQVSSTVFDKKNINPYEEGNVLTIGGKIGLNDDPDSFFNRHVGIRGEYQYYFKDPNKVSMHFSSQNWGQTQSASFTRIPSRASLDLFLTTGDDKRFQLNGSVGLLAYPGNQRNIANTSHVTTRLEAAYSLFRTSSPVNIQLYSRLQHIWYNKEFVFNEYFTPEQNQSTTVQAGIRLTYDTSPR